MAFCIKCGTELPPAAAFCGGCGTPRAANFGRRNTANQTASVVSVLSATPIATPASDAPSNWLFETAHVRSFVGEKYSYYRDQWNSIQSKGDIYTWNWAAFLLNLSWFSYRKMYQEATIYIVIISIFYSFYIYINAHWFIFFVTTWGINIFVGQSGNYDYRTHAEKRVNQTISENKDPTQLSAELARNGGTSIGAAIAFSVLLPLAYGIAENVILTLK